MKKDSTKYVKDVLRTRSLIVKHHNSGMSSRDISEKLNIPNERVEAVLQAYERRGECFLKNYLKPTAKIEVVLNVAERNQLVKLLKENSASKLGIVDGCIDAGYWKNTWCRALVLKKFGVAVPKHECLRFMREVGVKVIVPGPGANAHTHHVFWRDRISDEFKQWKKTKPKQLAKREAKVVKFYRDPAHVFSTFSGSRGYSESRIKYQLSDGLIDDSLYLAEQLANTEDKFHKKMSK